MSDIRNEIPDIVGKTLMREGAVPGSSLMVAFSGGADSTALLLAVAAAGYVPVGLHCNFHLRGAESDRDERFCRELCLSMGVELKVRHFDVYARVASTGESVEMAARELRYEWFDSEHAATGMPLLTAHHASDNVETFFLNLLRGSGLRGLAAIPPARDYILRPLLGVERGDLTAYLAAEGTGYVTDSTNLKPDFKRNRLRLETLPALEAQFPGAMEAVGRSVSNLRSLQRLRAISSLPVCCLTLWGPRNSIICLTVNLHCRQWKKYCHILRLLEKYSRAAGERATCLTGGGWLN